MKRTTGIAVLSLFFLLGTATTQAASGGGNFTIGVGPIGNLFIFDSRPELDPGIGGFVYFDYRWSPQLSTTVTVLVANQDGTGPDNGDNDIILFGLPTFDIKYYFLTRASKWDPYAQMGVGTYALSEGSVSNGTPAVGLGADIGFGFDYYFTEQWTVGLGMQYRSIGLITDWDGPGTGIFPLSLTGSVAMHF